MENTNKTDGKTSTESIGVTEMQLIDESAVAQHKAMGGKLMFKIGNCQPTEDIKEANHQLNEMGKEIRELAQKSNEARNEKYINRRMKEIVSQTEKLLVRMKDAEKTKDRYSFLWAMYGLWDGYHDLSEVVRKERDKKTKEVE